jgi:uncharacterized membrane protein (UPF0127 family)
VIESEPKHRNRISRTRNLSILVVAALYIVVLCVVALRLRTEYVDIHIGNHLINAQVSSTETQRDKGLSGTSSLGSNDGMLFVFTRPGNYGFWMKDMNYNLDIVWLNSNKKVSYIAQNLSPRSYPSVYFPSYPSKYVLELNAGSVKKLNIIPGEQINF